jgi:hypothetical protein
VSRVFYCALIAMVVALFVCGFQLADEYQMYREIRDDYSAKLRLSSEAIVDHEWLSSRIHSHRSLVDAGIVGKQDELSWVDLLAPLQQHVAIDDYHFEIAAPIAHPMNEEVHLINTSVSLYGKLMHDGVLEQLLVHLTENAPGGWYFESLEVLKSPESIAAQGQLISVPELEVVLKIVWVVVSAVLPGEVVT